MNLVKARVKAGLTFIYKCELAPCPGFSETRREHQSLLPGTAHIYALAMYFFKMLTDVAVCCLVTGSAMLIGCFGI